MVKVEFHCHTRYSKDSLVDIADMPAAARKKALDHVVITDHNAIQGAFEANRLDPAIFIIGEEIMTQQGELLGFFMTELIPPGLSAQKAIRLLREQSAFISVSHPFDISRKGHWDENDLLEILPLVDAIEVFNSRCISPQFNQKAKEFTAQHAIAGTVGSDAHSLRELGTATLTLPDFHDAASLKLALTQAQPQLRLSSPFIHFISRYAVWRKKATAKRH